MMAMGVWEGMEVAVEGKGPGAVCGDIPIDRSYRVVFSAIIGSLPALVTTTIFFFPALVSLEAAMDQMNGPGSCAPKKVVNNEVVHKLDALLSQAEI